MKAVTEEILAAFLREEVVPDYAAAEDESSFGAEWHFSDGSVFWIDIDPAYGPRFLWRKGKDGKAHTGTLSPAERS